MQFSHSPEIWSAYPELAPGVLSVEGIDADADVSAALERFQGIAANRLAAQPEGELPEIQAWRRTFTRMGLKPTQYRCASEALLRRYRQERSLPRIHPLIDLCNAVSMAFAVPVAAFDVAHIAGDLTVRHAKGTETYEAFSGETEYPDAGEVVFADDEGWAHARRWTNRQSARSAVRASTRSVLVVAEAMHASARSDVERLLTALAAELEAAWSAAARTEILTSTAPQYAL